MHTFIRYFASYLLIQIALVSTTYALSLESKYPSYTYVFNEFDVDASYLHNDDFISFVLQHEKKLKSFCKRSLRRGSDVMPMMQDLLVDDGMSDLLIYLSMLESGFASDAISSKKAVGLWQFMPATARDYNLTVCSSYDERRDTVSATSAAIHYLNKLHKQFGKWYLAMMAYNCGEGCLSRAIKRAGTDELSVLTDGDLKYVPRETRQYIKKILLVAMIGENVTLGFSNNKSDDLENALIEVEIFAGTTLKEIAVLLKMKEKKLLNLNGGLKNAVLPDDKAIYKITIPIEKIYAFYLRYGLPVLKKRYRSHMISHNVGLGETLEEIAKRYEADKEEIKISNHLVDEFLTVDALLVIPVTENIFEKVSK